MSSSWCEKVWSIRTAALGCLVLLVALLGPPVASAALNDTQKCGFAKLKATQAYTACRVRALTKAVTKNIAPDYSKCELTLQKAFDRADLKYGINCPFGDSSLYVGFESADETTNRACRLTSPMSGPGGSVLVFDVPNTSALFNAKIYIRNLGNSIANARCFFADTSKRCSDTNYACSDDSSCAPTGTCVPSCNVAGHAFDLTLFAQRQIYWYPSNGTGGIPAFPAPSSGQIVCVQVDASGAPLSGNSLVGGIATDANCPTASAITVQGTELNDGDTFLDLGGAFGFPEYFGCPSEISPSIIENCWSQSDFGFSCQ